VYRGTEGHHGPIQIFKPHAAPALRIRYLSLESLPPSLFATMPWRQLTTLALSQVSRAGCMQALRQATALQEFQREDTGDIRDEAMPEAGEPQLHHSSLISLSVSTRRRDESILHLLAVPCLERLEIGNIQARLSPTAPVHWFNHLTELTTLELILPGTHHDRDFQPDIIQALDRRTSHDFLPRLRTFVLSEALSDTVDDTLLRALDSRCELSSSDADAGHARLESFSLFWAGYRPNPTVHVVMPLVNVTALRALAARGMRIHVGTRSLYCAELELKAPTVEFILVSLRTRNPIRIPHFVEPYRFPYTIEAWNFRL
ncbi:hypothetical protein FB45DRAFT_1131373, partial [Roridomyces roridus]